jgi:hypothetical protein
MHSPGGPSGGLPRPGSTKTKNPYFLQGPTERPSLSGLAQLAGFLAFDPLVPKVLTCNHSAILNLSFFGLDQDMATKWPYTGSPGFILGAFCTIFRA